jgi:hypothetical protein
MALSRATTPRIGDYSLVRLISRGAATEVWEAQRAGAHGFSIRCVVKRLRAELARDRNALQSFSDEARAHSELEHPNVLRCLDFGEAAGEVYLVLEHVPGRSCAELLTGLVGRGRGMSLAPSLHLARELLRALAFVHTATDEQGAPLGLVHRNVTPANVLVSHAGAVKLADFGSVGRAGTRAPPLPDRQHRGLVHRPPEVVLGGAVDARSDLFAVGALLGALLDPERFVLPELKGEAERAPASSRARLPHDIANLIYSAIAPRCEHRPASAHAFAEQLEGVARERGLSLGDDVLAGWLAEAGFAHLTSGVREAEAGRPNTLRAPPSAPRRIDRQATTVRPPAVDPRATAMTLPPSAPPAARARPTLPPRVASAQRAPQVTLPDGTQRDGMLEDSPPNVGLLRDPGAHEDESTVRLGTRAASLLGRPAPLHARFVLRDAVGNVTEPLGYVQVLERLGTGRLGRSLRIADAGSSSFLPLEEHPVFGRAAKRATERFASAASGALRRVTLSPLAAAEPLYRAVLNEASGRFVLRDGNQVCALHFASGEIVHSAASDSDTLLGQVLVQHQGLPPTELDAALVEATSRHLPLGSVLVKRGVITPSKLASALETQRVQRVALLLQATRGTLDYYPGAAASSPASVLTEPTLRALSRAFVEGTSLERLTHALAPMRAQRLVRCPDAERLTLALGLPLTHARALARAPHEANVEVLAKKLLQEGVAPALATLQAVYVGLCAGLLALGAKP